MARAGKAGGPAKTIPDRVLAGVGAAMLLLAVYLLLFGGPADEGSPSPGAGSPPSLALLRPSDGDTLDSAELELRSGTPLAPQPGGWGSGGFHVHADVDGREIMPGPADIRRIDPESYLWTLPALPGGTHRVSLFWSDSSHRRVEGTGTATATFVIR